MNYVLSAIKQELVGCRFLALRYSNGCRGLINVDNVLEAKISQTLVIVKEKENLKPNLEKQLVYYLNCDNKDIAKYIYDYIMLSRSGNDNKK